MSSTDGPARNLRNRKSKGELNGDGANGHGAAAVEASSPKSKAQQSWISDHGRAIDKKLDEHHEWVFAGIQRR